MSRNGKDYKAVTRWVVGLCACGMIGVSQVDVRAVETPFWLNATDGLWSEAANWSGGVVPDADSPQVGDTYEVTIDATGAPYSVQADANANRINLDNLILDSPDLTLHLPFRLWVNQNIDLRQGTILLDGYQPNLYDATITGESGAFIVDPMNDSNFFDVTIERDILVRGGQLNFWGDWRQNGVITVRDAVVSFNKASGETYQIEDIGQVILDDGTIGVGGTLDNTNRRFAPDVTDEQWVLSGRILGGAIGPFPDEQVFHVRALGIDAELDGVSVEGVIHVDPDTRLKMRNAWSIVEGGAIVGVGDLDLGGSFTSASVGRISGDTLFVSIIGELDNVGGEVTFAQQRWGLEGGVIRGGVIRSTEIQSPPDNTLMYGILDGVRFDADMEVLNVDDDVLMIENGMSIAEGRLMDFRDAHLVAMGDQTFSGEGRFFFTEIDVPSGRLILEADTAIDGGSFFHAFGSAGGSVVNRGRMELLWHDGRTYFRSDRFANEGSFRLNDRVVANQDLSLSFSGEFVNAGVFEIDETVPIQFHMGYTQNSGTTRLRSGAIEIDPGFSMTLNGGRLEAYSLDIDGDLVNTGGVLSPDQLSGFEFGTYTVNGDYTQGPDGTLELDLRRIGQSDRDQDRLIVNGHASLAGTLKLDWADNWSSFPGIRRLLLTYGSFSGGFDRIESSIASDLAMVPEYEADGLYLRVAIPGDFDLNGQVDVLDLNRWAQGFGSEVGFGEGFAAGDANQDGQVDVLDLSVWAVNFSGRSVGGVSALPLETSSSALAIPEPACFVLMGLGSGVLLGRRTRVL